MGLFGITRRRSREADSAAPVEQPAGDAAQVSEVQTVVPETPPATDGGGGPPDKLASLQERRLPFTQLCAEVLELVLETFRVRAGALLVYDPRGQRLVLAAERGLSAAARQRLLNVRRNDSQSWDMPLHGLLNERIYLIDRPAENRYVPPLDDQDNRTLRRIACLPIYQQRWPVGTFVLLSETSDRLTEQQIGVAQKAFRQLAAMIDEAHQRDGISAPAGSGSRSTANDDTEPAMSSLQATASEGLDRAELAPETAGGAPYPAGPNLSSETTPAREDARGQAAPAGAPHDTVAVLEAREQRLRGEIVRLQGELAAAQTAIEHRSAQWEDERDRAFGRLRADLSAEHERALAVVRAERDEIAATLAALKASLDARPDRSGERAEEAGRVRDLEAELAAARETASEATQRLHAAQGELETHERRIGELEAERVRLQAEALVARERLARGADQIDSLQPGGEAPAALVVELRDQLTATQAEVEARGRMIEELKTANARLKTDHAAVVDELARASEQTRRLETRIGLSGTEAAELAAELSANRAKEEANARIIAELKARTQHLDADRASLAEQCQHLEQDVRTLREDVTAREQAMQEVRREIELATGQTRAAVERERGLRETMERTRSEWEAREARATEEIEHVRLERDESRERLAQAEASLGESVAALKARVAAEAAALATAEELRQEVGRLRERVATVEQDVERTRAEATAAGEREHGARREADLWRGEAEKLAGRIGELEQAARVAVERTADLEGREQTARREAEHWRTEAERARSDLAALDQRVQTATTDVTRAAAAEEMARREGEQWREAAAQATEREVALTRTLEQARAEATRWQQTADELGQRLAAMEREAQGRQDEADPSAEQERRAQHQAEVEALVGRLESERRAAYAEAARAREEVAASAESLQKLQAERDEQVRRVAALEAAVARLEAGRVTRSVDQSSRAAARPKTEAETPGRGDTAGSRAGTKAAPPKGEAKAATRQPSKDPASAATIDDRLIVIEPVAAMGEALAGKLGPAVQVIVPTADVAAMVRDVERAEATVVALNLGCKGPAGGFHLLGALGALRTAGLRVWGYVAPAQATKAIPLGFVHALAQPVESADLVELLMSLCSRGMRVLSVGLEMDGLLNVREQLTQQGVSLSMAWDSKQGQELLDMVSPHAVVVNLDLERGDGYRTLGRLAGNDPRHTWVLCGGKTPPADAGALVVSGATERGRVESVVFSDLGAALLADLRSDPDGKQETASGKARQQPGREGSAGTAGARSNTAAASRTTAAGRKNSAPGSQRRMPVS